MEVKDVEMIGTHIKEIRNIQKFRYLGHLRPSKQCTCRYHRDSKFQCRILCLSDSENLIQAIAEFELSFLAEVS